MPAFDKGWGANPSSTLAAFWSDSTSAAKCPQAWGVQLWWGSSLPCLWEIKKLGPSGSDSGGLLADLLEGARRRNLSANSLRSL